MDNSPIDLTAASVIDLTAPTVGAIQSTHPLNADSSSPRRSYSMDMEKDHPSPRISPSVPSPANASPHTTPHPSVPSTNSRARQSPVRDEEDDEEDQGVRDRSGNERKRRRVTTPPLTTRRALPPPAGQQSSSSSSANPPKDPKLRSTWVLKGLDGDLTATQLGKM